ncbi:MAG TPA: isochorismatase family protein, partial [Candidatus Limnocylindria bacterium]|nr:isochorismatase family protein [Candidatus Limnocylindria bacterium]
MIEYGERTALLVVDVQNDFADPAGSLSVRGGEGIIGRVNDEVARAVAGGALVVYTQDWHPEHTPHFAQDGGIWPVHCVADSPGAALVPGLPVVGPVVRKGT